MACFSSVVMKSALLLYVCVLDFIVVLLLFFFNILHLCSFAGHNYCTVNNGGCTHLCLATPGGRTCRCPDNTVGVDCIERN